MSSNLTLSLYDCATNVTLWTSSIPHKYSKPAKDAGVYTAIWRPAFIQTDTHDYPEALIPILERGLTLIKNEEFRGFVENYLSACRTYPTASIKFD